MKQEHIVCLRGCSPRILDVHAFPGGSQQGTYNSVWPNRPVFWTESSKVRGPTKGLFMAFGGSADTVDIGFALGACQASVSEA